MNRIRAIAPLVVLGVVVVMISMLFARAASGEPARHAAFQADVRRLGQLDARIDELILETRSGFRRDYDELAAKLGEGVEIMRALATSSLTRHPAVGGPIRDALAELAVALERKGKLVERFKSSNAIRDNSARFFPAALAAAMASRPARHRGVPDGLADLSVATMRLALHGGESAVDDVLSSCRCVGDGGSDAAAAAADTLVAHAEKLASYTGATDRIVRDALDVPTGQIVDSLERLVLRSHAAAVRVTESHRGYLYAVSIALLVYSVMTWISLRRTTRELHRSNVDLERRIAVRTSDLSRSNAELRQQVGERRRAERALAASARDLQQSNRELEDFTYIAAHDLQEPLRKVTAFSGLLEKDLGDDLPPRAAEDLAYLADAARRMKKLIEDLLLLSRTGTTELASERVELSRCVEQATEALSLRIEETGAVIEIGDLPAVDGDRTLLTQLFQNLIGNALKFVEAGRPRIEITCEPIGCTAIVGVRDNGIGIDREHAEKIFAPFKRLHGRGQYEGTGIGLAIARKAVERHGGSIWVESEVGQGAHFRCSLPAADSAVREPAAVVAT